MKQQAGSIRIGWVIEYKNKNILIASVVSALYVVLMLVFKLKELNYFIVKIGAKKNDKQYITRTKNFKSY